MIIIGEKINGAIPSVAKAIKNRDGEWIANLALDETRAGADYLDVCAGTAPDEEVAALEWLIETVQSVTDMPVLVHIPTQATTGSYSLYAGAYAIGDYPASLTSIIDHEGPVTATVT